MVDKYQDLYYHKKKLILKKLIKRCGGTGPMKHSNRNVKIRGAKSCKPSGLRDKK